MQKTGRQGDSAAAGFATGFKTLYLFPEAEKRQRGECRIPRSTERYIRKSIFPLTGEKAACKEMNEYSFISLL